MTLNSPLAPVPGIGGEPTPGKASSFFKPTAADINNGFFIKGKCVGSYHRLRFITVCKKSTLPGL